METIRDYHDETKHHFCRFARSLGYLDWKNQPHPFREYVDTEKVTLPRVFPDAKTPYYILYSGDIKPQPVDIESVGRFLRYSLGLSAWKEFQGSRWALRVNPSSGNLHPTEAYLIGDLQEGKKSRAAVRHYRPDSHELECRAVIPEELWRRLFHSDKGQRGGFLVGLSSIIWREAWKYGERAFRYCQHDTGHAIAALRFSAALLGWKLELLSDWADSAVGTICGLHRRDDFVAEEREVPEALAIVYPNDIERPWVSTPSSELVSALEDIDWQGTANRLSMNHVPWQIIDEAVAITEKNGAAVPVQGQAPVVSGRSGFKGACKETAEEIILKRRSAQALDQKSRMSKESFSYMMTRVLPASGSPWDSLWWPPHISLLVFIHRVDDVTPGMYMLIRNPEHGRRLQEACSGEFPWSEVSLSDGVSLYLLQEGDAQMAATLVSCRQDIAGDGFFSVGMIADFGAGLKKYGDSFYRCLFWESGVVGQVLYLEAEANRCRGTGIGCYFDDAVHQLVGLTGNNWQSLYHFTVGIPIIDARLTSAPGYPEEQSDNG